MYPYLFRLFSSNRRVLRTGSTNLDYLVQKSRVLRTGSTQLTAEKLRYLYSRKNKTGVYYYLWFTVQ